MAGLDLQKAGFNVEAVKNGHWIELSQGGEVCVARWNNPQYRALETKLYQEYRRPRPGPRIKGNTIPSEVQEEITLRLVVETILKDWRGFTDGGAEFPCTKENKMKLLGNEAFRWIMEEVIAAAREEEAYQQEVKEEDLGNSVPVSVSDSSTVTETSNSLSS